MIPSQIGEFYINLDDFGGAKNKNQNLNITVGITFLLKWCWFMWSTNVCPVYILQNLVSLFFTVGRGAGDHVWGRGSNSGQVTARQESYPLYNCSGLLKPRKASWRVWERFILAKLVIGGGARLCSQKSRNEYGIFVKFSRLNPGWNHHRLLLLHRENGKTLVFQWLYWSNNSYTI